MMYRLFSENYKTFAIMLPFAELTNIKDLSITFDYLLYSNL